MPLRRRAEDLSTPVQWLKQYWFTELKRTRVCVRQGQQRLDKHLACNAARQSVFTRQLFEVLLPYGTWAERRLGCFSRDQGSLGRFGGGPELSEAGGFTHGFCNALFQAALAELA